MTTMMVMMMVVWYGMMIEILSPQIVKKGATARQMFVRVVRSLVRSFFGSGMELVRSILGVLRLMWQRNYLSVVW